MEDKAVSTIDNLSVFKEFGNMAKLLEYIKPLLNNGLHEGTIEQFASKVLFANGLNIAPEQIFVIAKQLQIIQGQICINASLMQALIDRAKIRHQTIEDAVRIYEYTTSLTNGTIIEHDLLETIKNVKVYYTPEQLNSNKEKDIIEGFLPLLRNKIPIDIRTKIKFTRFINGVETVEYGVFSFKDAEAMGLTEKNNWKRMLRQMLYARAFSLGAKRIANDIINGLYLIEELSPDTILGEQEYTTHTEL